MLVLKERCLHDSMKSLQKSKVLREGNEMVLWYMWQFNWKYKSSDALEWSRTFEMVLPAKCSQLELEDRVTQDVLSNPVQLDYRFLEESID